MKPEPNSITDEVRQRQRNIVFPDTVKNARRVDALLLRGDPNAPLVQRVGAWVFGCFFLLCGIACLGLAIKSHATADWIYSVAGFLIGTKVLISGFRRRSRTTPRVSKGA
jgi:hypothetical protein